MLKNQLHVIVICGSRRRGIVRGRMGEAGLWRDNVSGNVSTNTGGSSEESDTTGDQTRQAKSASKDQLLEGRVIWKQTTPAKPYDFSFYQ